MGTLARRTTLPATGFASDLTRGLRERPKQVPSKYFYDDAGSALFDRICELEEYYLPRAELEILEGRARAIGERAGPGLRVVELGSGSGNKTRALLDALHDPLEYLAVDVSAAPLEAAARALRLARPALHVQPVVADFTAGLRLPPAGRHVQNTLVYFPGSTIGNLTPGDAVDLLQGLRAACGPCDLVLGVDLKKEPARLHAAYNDRAGVTAAFNKNVLVRANRELGADFDVDAFEHYAFYAPEPGRVEMHLVSRREQSVRVGSRTFDFDEGESMLTEYSYKYTAGGVEHLAVRGGFAVDAWWTDAAGDFAVGLLRGRSRSSDAASS